MEIIIGLIIAFILLAFLYGILCLIIKKWPVLIWIVGIGKLIEEELHRQERSVTWFANKLYCDRTNTYKIFKRQSIDTELLLRISQVLHVNFFEYYSRECQNREK